MSRMLKTKGKTHSYQKENLLNCRLIKSSSGGGVSELKLLSDRRRRIGFFVMFCNHSPRVIHWENPHIKSEVKSRKEVMKAVTHKMYRRLTLKKRKLIETVKARSFIYFCHSPRNNSFGSPYLINLEKKRTSPKKLHHIIANEQNSVHSVVFSLCLGAVISKLVLDQYSFACWWAYSVDHGKKMGNVEEWWCRQRVPEAR